MRTLGAAALGYVAGLLPSAEIIARGVDPRRAGSGNPGAANIANLLGRRAGAAVFGMDMAKAVVAARLGRVIAGGPGANAAASAAVLGHCFPAHRKMRGGKGVAASFGQMLATFPAYLPVDIVLAAIAARSDFWKRRPVATISATCVLWTGLAVVAARRGAPNLWAPRAQGSTAMAAAVSSAAIVYRFAAEANRPRPTDDEPETGEPGTEEPSDHPHECAAE